METHTLSWKLTNNALIWWLCYKTLATVPPARHWRSNQLTSKIYLSNIMKKSEIIEEAKKYLVPVYVSGRTCYICNAVQYSYCYSPTEVREITNFIQDTLDDVPGMPPGLSIKAHTPDMTDEERYELRLMFMDFLILYQLRWRKSPDLCHLTFFFSTG